MASMSIAQARSARLIGSSRCSTALVDVRRHRQAGGRRPAPRRAAATRAMLTVTDSTSGVQWPLAHKFWEGEDMHCLGAVTRSKKILVMAVKVYSLAVYVEGVRAAKELGIRHRGGFMDKDGDFCSALLDGAFNKVLLFQLVRDVTGQQFTDAINPIMEPRVSITGDSAALAELNKFMVGQGTMTEGTRFAFFTSLNGTFEVLVLPPSADAPAGDYTGVSPGLRIQSPGLARAFNEMFLGERELVPGGHAAWAKGAKDLLESEIVKRESRKQA